MIGSIRYRLVRRRLLPAILATNTGSSASMRSDTLESRFSLFHSHPNHVDTFHSFDFFNLDIFDFCRLLLKIQRLTILSVWRVSCPYRTCRNAMQKRGGAMSPVLIFLRKWNKWYRVLRYRKGFGLLDSVRYGLWLAHT
jgi:hypothetical protein